MTFRVAHWDMLDDKSCILVCKGKISMSLLMSSVMDLHFSMQGKDILEHTHGKCHFCTLREHTNLNTKYLDVAATQTALATNPTMITITCISLH